MPVDLFSKLLARRKPNPDVVAPSISTIAPWTPSVCRGLATPMAAPSSSIVGTGIGSDKVTPKPVDREPLSLLGSEPKRRRFVWTDDAGIKHKTMEQGRVLVRDHVPLKARESKGRRERHHLKGSIVNVARESIVDASESSNVRVKLRLGKSSRRNLVRSMGKHSRKPMLLVKNTKKGVTHFTGKQVLKMGFSSDGCMANRSRTFECGKLVCHIALRAAAMSFLVEQMATPLPYVCWLC